MESLNFQDDAWLQESVYDGLQSPGFYLKDSSVLTEFFDRRGRIPALQILVYGTFLITKPPSLALL